MATNLYGKGVVLVHLGCLLDCALILCEIPGEKGALKGPQQLTKPWDIQY